MKCPKCGADDTRTKDSRPTADGTRRRRQCKACGHLFTTYEYIKKDHAPPITPAAVEGATAELAAVVAAAKQQVQSQMRSLRKSQRVTLRLHQQVSSAADRPKPAKEAGPTKRVTIPEWVPPAFHLTYRHVAATQGEHEAAAYVRRMKAEGKAPANHA
jgi:hypothetical protein